MRTRLTVTLALCLAANAGADVLPPGHKTVAHDIFIEGMEAFPEYAFFVGPLSMTGGVQEVMPGHSLSFYKFAAPLLWAVRKPVAETPTLSELRDSSNPRSEKPFFVISSVPRSDPTTRIRTTFTVKSVEKGVIHLERSDKRSSREREPSDRVLALLSLAGVLGLAVLSRPSR